MDWLADTRRRMWEAAASDNGVSYWCDGDDWVIHDPSIMRPGDAVLMNLNSLRYTDAREMRYGGGA